MPYHIQTPRSWTPCWLISASQCLVARREERRERTVIILQQMVTFWSIVEYRRAPQNRGEPRRSISNFVESCGSLSNLMDPNGTSESCKTLQDLRILFFLGEKTVRDRVNFFEPRRNSLNLIERCGTSGTCRILHSSIQPYGSFFAELFRQPS